jgi:hypothetical protein
LNDAIAFAMGWSDLGLEEPTAEHRKGIGLVVIDQLQYHEQWRVAAMLRACLAARWGG